jgi:protein ImuA
MSFSAIASDKARAEGALPFPVVRHPAQHPAQHDDDSGYSGAPPTPRIARTPSTHSADSRQDADERAARTARRRKLDELAERVRQLQFARRSWGRCPTGLTKLDAVLGGGFARGCIHELLTPTDATAAWSLALWAATQAVSPSPEAKPTETTRSWIFYIDTRGDFYPPGTAQLGVPLERLLIIRTPRTTDALWVCEQALRCKAVAAIVLPIRTIDAYVSRRLQLAAETGGGLGLVLRREAQGGHTFAATRLRIDPLPHSGPSLAGRWPTRMSTAAPLDLPPNESPIPGLARNGAYVRQSLEPLAGENAPPDTIQAIRRLQITPLKLREGRLAEPFELTLPFAAAGEATLRPVPQPPAPPLQTRSGSPPSPASAS